MIYIWNECQESGSYQLTREELLDIHPDLPDFADAIVEAKLGRSADDGTIYICGTKGRIEWLAKARENAKYGVLGRDYGAKGGRPRNPRTGDKENSHAGVTETPTRGGGGNPPPAPAPAPAHKDGEEHIVPPDPLPYREIIGDLNARAGTAYKTGAATRELIHARWAEGFRLEDFRKVHRTKVAEWAGTDQAKFLRPETLYNRKKFEAYLNQPEPVRGRGALQALYKDRAFTDEPEDPFQAAQNGGGGDV